MNLQDKLISLSEYNIGFRINDKSVYVNITYKDKWQVISPEDENVKLMKGKDENTFFYTTDINSDKNCLQNIFDTIDETIRYNKEVEATVQLFKEKMEELEKVFEEKSYEELKTLTFTFNKKTAKTKKTVNTDKPKDKKKKKTEEAVVETEKNDTDDFDKKIEESIKKKTTKNK